MPNPNNPDEAECQQCFDTGIVPGTYRQCTCAAPPKPVATKGPASRPCGSCPYRQDAPSGLWHESEYAKLPSFDLPIEQQPQSTFLCHQQDGRLCAGWVGCHDMTASRGLLAALILGQMEPEEVLATLNYESPVPLFESGREAAEHGLRDQENPDLRARRLADRLTRTKDGVRFG